MKLLRFVLPASIPVILLAAGHAITACGSSTPATTGPGSGQDATTGGGQDGSPTTNPGPNDGATNQDTSTPPGNPDAAFPDGGIVLPPVEAGSLGSVLPGPPGVIECGPIACDIDGSTCCANTDGGTSCPSGTTTTCAQATLHCAQAADCPSGQICCGVVNVTNVSLQASCSAGPCKTDKDIPPGAQLCAMGTTECPSASPCTKQSCQGESVQLCGLFNFTNPLVTVKCTPE